ncbi:MAG TPA: pyrroline-5-carboxylate reductase [Levilinea sp.]|nr:pyrroline-5-carboxylate reductase [Levilinea sp.]
MKKNPLITIIGPGVMGEAMLTGLLRVGLTPHERIRISGPELDRNAVLEECHKVKSFSDNRLAVEHADAVILAVKPQRIQPVMVSLRGSVPTQALVLSIVAGTSIETLTNGLNHVSIVRAMPNTPAQIGQGITVWTSSSNVTGEQMDLACSILHALGPEVYMEEESYLDMATALSGSGPAYVFLFLEALIDAGVHLGFQRRIAEQLVIQTVRGSVEYYSQKTDHPAHLRNEVTSPAGTSAAALYYLEKAGFRTAISRAIWAAYERSQELGKGRHSQPPEKLQSE